MRCKSGNGSGQRRGYHHGNLREALIEAALDLIARRPAGSPCRGRPLAGSARPPLSPFPRPRGLLADVARAATSCLTAQLERAWNEGRPDAFAAFEASGGPISPSPATSRPLLGDVRGRHPARRQRGAAPGRRCGLCRIAPGGEAFCARLAARERPPADDEPAFLGLVARHRVSCSRAATPAGVACRCRRRSCWKRAFSSICAASASSKPNKPRVSSGKGPSTGPSGVICECMIHLHRSSRP